MKWTLILLWGILAVLPLSADEPWVLVTGPEAVDSIPVDPVQPVSAWRGFYTDGVDRFWVYLTRSPFFFVQSVPDARLVSGTSWNVVVFFPALWKTGPRVVWLDRWVADFRVLLSLASGDVPAFPAILTKG